MKRIGHFTLIEMLVVIAIISTLAAMLSPSLRKAYRSAQNQTCVNNMRMMGVAGNMYAMQSDNAWLPFEGMCCSENEYCKNARWGNNKLFLELMGRPNVSNWAPQRVYWRMDALCPLAKPKTLDSLPGAGSVNDRCYGLVCNKTLTPVINPESTIEESFRFYVRLPLVRHPAQRFAFCEISTDGGNIAHDNVVLEDCRETDENCENKYGWISYRHGNLDRTNCCFFDGHVATKYHFDVNWKLHGRWETSNQVLMQFYPYDKIK